MARHQAMSMTRCRSCAGYMDSHEPGCAGPPYSPLVAEVMARGEPRCGCGRARYRPDQTTARRTAARCVGCHKVVGLCRCEPLTASERAALDGAIRGLYIDPERPRTHTGKWLLDHQGLVNIGRIDGSMRGDEIDLRAAIVTIEKQAASEWRAAYFVLADIAQKKLEESR